jgi:AraC-like DNA-binding protein
MSRIGPCVTIFGSARTKPEEKYYQLAEEIAYKMNYSSVAHLSTQFKKVTGLSPSHFKNLKVIIRTPNSVNA